MRILLDTGILIRSFNIGDPQHTLVQGALRRLRSEGARLELAPQVIYEFYSVSTRPSQVNGRGRAPAQTLEEVARALAAFPCEPDPPNLLQRWLELCGRYRPSGKPAHDTRLVVYVEAQWIDAILTLNPADFARYTNLPVLTP